MVRPYKSSDLYQTAGEADATQTWTDVVPHPNTSSSDALAHC